MSERNPRFTNKPTPSRPLSLGEQREANRLFRISRLNTNQISLRMRIAESDVERALHHLWDADGVRRA